MKATPTPARVLAARGVLTDPAWHRALLAVSRGPYVPDTVWIGSKDHPGWNMPVTADDPEYASWIDADLALITQVDDGTPAGGWRPGRSHRPPRPVRGRAGPR